MNKNSRATQQGIYECDVFIYGYNPRLMILFCCICSTWGWYFNIQRSYLCCLRFVCKCQMGQNKCIISRWNHVANSIHIVKCNWIGSRIFCCDSINRYINIKTQSAQDAVVIENIGNNHLILGRHRLRDTIHCNHTRRASCNTSLRPRGIFIPCSRIAVISSILFAKLIHKSCWKVSDSGYLLTHVSYLD